MKRNLSKIIIFLVLCQNDSRINFCINFILIKFYVSMEAIHYVFCIIYFYCIDA